MSMSSEDYDYDYECVDGDNQDDDEDLSIEDTLNDRDISFQDHQSILAISYQDYKIGIALYHVGSVRIELLHEMYEFDDFTVIRKVLTKFAPTDVVISSKCEKKLFSFLKYYSNQDSNPSENRLDDTNQNSTITAPDSSVANENLTNSKGMNLSDTPILDESTLNNRISFKLNIVSGKFFDYDLCKSRILAINFPQISNISDKTERFIYLTSYIDFVETNTIKSLGVLLQFIEKQWVNQNPTNAIQLNALSDFVYFDLDHFVSIDQVTFEALDIFQNEWHPSISQKGLAKKEGFTLFGVFNSCASKIGSNYLKRLFLQPITDSTLLEERFAIINFFTNPNNSNLKETLFHFLKNIKDPSSIINRLQSMSSTISDFRLIHQTVLSTISIRNIISNYSTMNINSQVDKLKIFQTISKNFTQSLDEIYQCLEKTIDFKKSKEDGKIMIKKGIDDQLDQLKFYFNKLPDILKISISKEDFVNELVQNYNVHITIIYLPQLGFLLKLLLVETQKIAELDKFGLELIFCANDSAYYKNSQTIQFDKIFGDILSEIYDRTQQVLMVIKDYLLERVNTLSVAVNYCAFLDAMIAMSQTAIDYNFVKPNLTCYGTINIHQGRHPLYEQITKTFVPNDYYSDDSLCKTLLVFGLNGCGKTVYLKQVCLIVYLAHIGSFVPATFAEISIVDKIFTRIRTPESISTQLSSFKHDLNQMITATKYAKRRSLVVIDLFGKSTIHSDGFALLEAFLNHWINKDNRPYLIISTQFNLFSRLSLCENEIQFYSFENSNGERDFNLRPFQKDKDVTFSDHIAPELLDINNLIKNNVDPLVPKLERKQKYYLELADLILNNKSFEILNQFLKEIKSSIRN